MGGHVTEARPGQFMTHCATNEPLSRDPAAAGLVAKLLSRDGRGGHHRRGHLLQELQREIDCNT